MTVFAQLAVSLDGYVAGPNDGRGNPLGDRGERVHAWVYSLATRRERQGLTGGRSGATVMGRRTFDNGEEPWGREPPFRTPVFVVTSRAREPLRREGGTTFTFVTEGLESAVERARAAAGAKDVRVAGGADVLQQTLAAGLLDELELHLAPVFLGGGVRLFDRPELAGVRLEQTRVVNSPRVARLGYHLNRDRGGDPDGQPMLEGRLEEG